MGEPAEKRQAETSDDRFERLLTRLERLCHALERGLARDQDSARRAAKKAAPVPADIKAAVAARVARIRSKP